MKKSKTSLERIMERRMNRLVWLESCLKEVIKCSESTLKKIEAEGISGNFSCNHDVQKWADRVHSAAYEMWLLSDIESLIKNEEKVTKVIVEEDIELEETFVKKKDTGKNNEIS